MNQPPFSLKITRDEYIGLYTLLEAYSIRQQQVDPCAWQPIEWFVMDYIERFSESHRRAGFRWVMLRPDARRGLRLRLAEALMLWQLMRQNPITEDGQFFLDRLTEKLMNANLLPKNRTALPVSPRPIPHSGPSVALLLNTV